MSDAGDPRPTSDRSVAVFDIDGVLADVRHRLHHVAARPKDWAAFFDAAPQDPPLPEGLGAVRAAHQAGHLIVYLTGRPERCRADTHGWLLAHGLPDGALVMRRDSDRRPARVTKVLALRRLARRHVVAAVVDDDAAVVDAVRRAGFPVLHARWMGSSTSGADAAPDLPDAGTSQDVLFEIQESEGRT
jgi:phosphoglycolate phosphatase-like HAD superfamily hydrolase